MTDVTHYGETELQSDFHAHVPSDDLLQKIPIRIINTVQMTHSRNSSTSTAWLHELFFYRIADRAVKHCRSSRSTTHGGMVRNPLTLAKQGNKQTQTPQTKTSKANHKHNQTPTSGKCQGRVKQMVKCEASRPTLLTALAEPYEFPEPNEVSVYALSFRQTTKFQACQSSPNKTEVKHPSDSKALCFTNTRKATWFSLELTDSC